ncbi:efflux RND transporter periplasmic adaptor subunit [Sphaerotilus sp.]|uniref:efflux RND transporter periplasmic adaptor subunit n=1 Tax=Sphaerotilus sp. TaxID=2093942 RepID=UPI0025DE577A|nr:efflux RND transporter periplasmic adaptor subunit [Sphaerotilus sp.]
MSARRVGSGAALAGLLLSLVALPGQADAPVRGVVRARQVAVLSSRLSAQITQMPFREGQSFRKGELLVAFDCERQRAQSKAAAAALRAHQKTFEVQRELLQSSAIGKMEVDVTQAQMEKAAAEVQALEVELRECQVFAPYAGRVVEAVAQAHETAGQGQPLLRIQGADDLELQLIVPSAWMSWLRSGTQFTFRIDETGESVTAAVLRVGASVDPVSQTVKIVAKLPTGRASVLPGMSGTAEFKRS